jgi:hypothetical protein
MANIFYFLVFIALCLFVATQILLSRRWAE